jgi:hypothetical protein
MLGARGWCGFECSLCALFFARCGSVEGEAVVSPGVYIRFLID